MKNIVCIIAIILGFHNIAAQEDGTKFYSPEFKWTIILPEGFASVATEDWKRSQEKGLAAVEETLETDLDGTLIPNTTLFVISKDPTDMMEANYQLYDGAASDYEQDFKDIQEIVYTTFKEQLPTTVITKNFSTERISGKLFYKCLISIKITDKITLQNISYGALFGEKDFTLNILYVDENTGKAFLDSWRASVFK